MSEADSSVLFGTDENEIKNDSIIVAAEQVNDEELLKQALAVASNLNINSFGKINQLSGNINVESEMQVGCINEGNLQLLTTNNTSDEASIEVNEQYCLNSGFDASISSHVIPIKTSTDLNFKLVSQETDEAKPFVNDSQISMVSGTEATKPAPTFSLNGSSEQVHAFSTSDDAPIESISGGNVENCDAMEIGFKSQEANSILKSDDCNSQDVKNVSNLDTTPEAMLKENTGAETEKEINQSEPPKSNLENQNQNKGHPLGSSQNPIRIIQQGNRYTPVQQLTQEQLQHIMQVVQQQHVTKNAQDNGGAMIFNPQTNTRIMYRVIYPSELHKPENSVGASCQFIRTCTSSQEQQTLTPNQKKQFRKKREESTTPIKINNEDDRSEYLLEMSKEEKEERKKHRPRTRSGRVSKPPKHMVKDYKHIHVLDWDEDYDDSDGGYSDFKHSDEDGKIKPSDNNETVFSSSLKAGKPKNFKCPSCEKSYIGQAGLARHYRLNPDHSQGGDNADFLSTLDSGSLHSEEGSSLNQDGSLSRLSDSIVETSKFNDSSLANFSEDSNTQDSVLSAGTISPIKMKRGHGRGNARGRWAHLKYGAQIRRKNKLKELVKQCSDEELMEIVLPRLVNGVSVWEFTMMKSEKGGSQPQVDAIYSEFKTLAKHVKKVCGDYLKPLSEQEINNEDLESPIIQVSDEKIASLLGLEPITYRVEDMPTNDTNTFSSLQSKLSAVSFGNSLSQNGKETNTLKRPVESPEQSESLAKKPRIQFASPVKSPVINYTMQPIQVNSTPTTSKQASLQASNSETLSSLRPVTSPTVVRIHSTPLTTMKSTQSTRPNSVDVLPQKQTSLSRILTPQSRLQTVAMATLNTVNQLAKTNSGFTNTIKLPIVVNSTETQAIRPSDQSSCIAQSLVNLQVNSSSLPDGTTFFLGNNTSKTTTIPQTTSLIQLRESPIFIPQPISTNVAVKAQNILASSKTYSPPIKTNTQKETLLIKPIQSEITCKTNQVATIKANGNDSKQNKSLTSCVSLVPSPIAASNSVKHNIQSSVNNGTELHSSILPNLTSTNICQIIKNSNAENSNSVQILPNGSTTLAEPLVSNTLDSNIYSNVSPIVPSTEVLPLSEQLMRIKNEVIPVSKFPNGSTNLYTNSIISADQVGSETLLIHNGALNALSEASTSSLNENGFNSMTTRQILTQKIEIPQQVNNLTTTDSIGYVAQMKQEVTQNTQSPESGSSTAVDLNHSYSIMSTSNIKENKTNYLMDNVSGKNSIFKSEINEVSAVSTSVSEASEQFSANTSDMKTDVAHFVQDASPAVSDDPQTGQLLLPDNANIYQTEDGGLMIESADGNMYQLQSGESLSLEMIQALLTGTISQVNGNGTDKV